MSTFNKYDTCMNCPDRTIEPNCHMTCESYLSRIKTKQEYKYAINNERMKDGAIRSYYKNLNEKIKRKNGTW